MRHTLEPAGRRRFRTRVAPLAGLMLSAGVLLLAATPGVQAAPRAVLGELFSADG
jgi:hypothetical protein